MNNRDLINEAFKVVFDNQRRFIEALVIPFSMLVGLDLLDLLEVPEVLGWVLGILGLLIYANFAIVTHRLVILGNDSVPRFGLTRVSNRELLFVAYSIGVTVVPGVLFLPVLMMDEGAIETVYTLIAAMAYVYIVARISLVLPGTAIDKWLTIPMSWSLTSPYQRSMVVVVILFPIVLSMLVGLPIMLIGFLLPQAALGVLNSIVGTVLLVFTIAILSLAYREIVDSKYGS